MQWGIAAGMVVVVLVFVFLALIIFKETRTHRFWSKRVDEGDEEMIRLLVQAEVELWRTERPPKGMPASVWQGVQALELLEVGRDYVRIASAAEPQFALVGGSRRQVSSALDQAKRITAHLAERFFYDVPHVRPDRVQVDVYSTFHEAGGAAGQRCILTTLARRGDAAEVDWDNDPPEAIAERLGARYRVDNQGGALPIEPDSEGLRVTVNGARRDGPEIIS